MAHVLGIVSACGRGPLVQQRLHQSSLLETAVSLMAEVADSVVVLMDPAAHGPEPRPRRGVDVVYTSPKQRSPTEQRMLAAGTVVVHDPLCPLVSAAFVRELVDGCSATGALVGVRPVVDTIKATDNGAISGTVDRDGLRVVGSPVVFAGALATGLVERLWSDVHLSPLVQELRQRGPVRLVVAPSAARRVEDASDLRLMASVDAVSHRVRQHG